MTRLYIIAALIVVSCGLTGWKAYGLGKSKCEATHNQERLDRAQAGEKLEQARRIVARERDELARKLKESAYADPVVVERCLSPNRVRRLNAIR